MLWRRLAQASAAALAMFAIGLPVPGAVAAGDPVLVGAGDIAVCGSAADTSTARLIAAIPGTVFTAGDNAYPDGTLENYRDCYGPTWGAFLTRTHPSLGNHEYGASDTAAGFYAYFGTRGGPQGRGYYAYSLGSWRIYVLNSTCWAVGGCGPRSLQVRWLKADLANNPRRCILAYWHQPLFSSGVHGNDAEVRPFWDALYAARADIVINGHDHDYERFSRQAPNGTHAKNGIIEFVVGTGGAELRSFVTVRRHSIVRNASTHGVLRLTLHDGSYDWRFIPEAGKAFTDARAGKSCTRRT